MNFARNTFNAGYSLGLQGAFFDRQHSGEFSESYARGYALGYERLMQHFDRINQISEAQPAAEQIPIAQETAMNHNEEPPMAVNDTAPLPD